MFSRVTSTAAQSVAVFFILFWQTAILPDAGGYDEALCQPRIRLRIIHIAQAPAWVINLFPDHVVDAWCLLEHYLA